MDGYRIKGNTHAQAKGKLGVKDAASFSTPAPPNLSLCTWWEPAVSLPHCASNTWPQLSRSLCHVSRFLSPCRKSVSFLMSLGCGEAQMTDQREIRGREFPSWHKESLEMLTWESTAEVRTPVRKRTDLLTFTPLREYQLYLLC